MKRSIFLLLNLLQVYASLLPYPEYETDLRKACPEPDYNQICSCWDNYPHGDNCINGKICCYNYCNGGSSCQTPKPKCPSTWYPGGCTTSTSTTTTTSATTTTKKPLISILLLITTKTTPTTTTTTTPQNNTCDPENLSSCPISQKCCFSGCSYECVVPEATCLSPWYPGGCTTSTSTTTTTESTTTKSKPILPAVLPTTTPPPPTTTTTIPQNNTCDPEYLGSCPFGQECCFSGCSYECVVPEVSCDPFNCNYEDCFDDFTGEDTCPDGLNCCYNGCENECLEPVYYRMSCPNDSIIEHEDVWTKFCLSDCNCPEYQLCCDSPCDCDLNICRNFIVQSATCPNYCDYNYNGYYCFSDDDCLGFNQLCCDCSYDFYGFGQCVDPVYGPPGPSGFIPIPIGIVPNGGSLGSLLPIG